MLTYVNNARKIITKPYVHWSLLKLKQVTDESQASTDKSQTFTDDYRQVIEES